MPAAQRPNPPTPRAAVVSASGPAVADLLRAKGMHVESFADPYSAAVELFRRPLAFRVAVLSLRGVYREELALIGTLRRRLPHVEVWLAEVEGRASALATAVAAGASALVDAEGFHRLDAPANAPPKEAEPTPSPVNEASKSRADADPLLSADELQALLHDEPQEGPAARAKPLKARHGRR